jgi:diguanylate cyclase (GGDEF)-like protein
MQSEVIRILMIKDSPEESRLIKEELKDAHGGKFELECADRLSKGLECIEKGNIDVVLLDLSLPDSQGFETFAKAYACSPWVPIVVLSGNNDESQAVKTVQAGAQDYLIKGEMDINVMVRSMYYAIERHRTMDGLRSMVFIDKLTGLYNRRGLFVLAEQQLIVANRTKRGLFVIYIDLDGMKMINDTMGHQEGDNALIDSAGILRKTFRKSDIIARIGGDEFVVVVIETQKENDEIIKARMEKVLKEHNAGKDGSYKLSMSVGITDYDPENPTSFEELLKHADILMYEQKEASGKP